MRIRRYAPNILMAYFLITVSFFTVVVSVFFIKVSFFMTESVLTVVESVIVVEVELLPQAANTPMHNTNANFFIFEFFG
jgi:hypothetical protein